MVDECLVYFGVGINWELFKDIFFLYGYCCLVSFVFLVGVYFNKRFFVALLDFIMVFLSGFVYGISVDGFFGYFIVVVK